MLEFFILLIPGHNLHQLNHLNNLHNSNIGEGVRGPGFGGVPAPGKYRILNMGQGRPPDLIDLFYLIPEWGPGRRTLSPGFFVCNIQIIFSAR